MCVCSFSSVLQQFAVMHVANWHLRILQQRAACFTSAFIT
jgi:hypothetical protein